MPPVEWVHDDLVFLVQAIAAPGHVKDGEKGSGGEHYEIHGGH
jgi:hypothetical protein